MESLKIYTDNLIDKEIIKSKRIAVIGFGSQGYGQGMNLVDSGCNVVFGVRLGGKSDVKAKDYGLKTASIEDAVKWSDIVQILIPDEIQAKVYKEQIEPYMKKGQYLMFSHGFNIHYGFIKPIDGVNVIMVAPKAPGHTVRSEYLAGKGVPSLIAVEKDFSGDSKQIALSYASAIGSGRAGVIETTFREETETDLFGEQAVLCGGCDYLIKTAFETLVEAGYSPYMAYFEVCHELKLIVDLIDEGGIEDMHYSVSNNAEYGDYTRGCQIINSETKLRMKNILSQIQDGSYAKEFMNEFSSGSENFKKLRKESEKHLIEKVGSEIRRLFKWGKSKLIDKTKN
ncbi:MAG: ketol-acid reductoisomerase [bacterium]|nr:ketol-acid reductoisomerase [bacterium]